MQDVGLDSNLISFAPQISATTHVWLALHAHRDEDLREHSEIIQYIQRVCKDLRVMLLHAPDHHATHVQSSREKAAKKPNMNPSARSDCVRSRSLRDKKSADSQLTSILQLLPSIASFKKSGRLCYWATYFLGSP